MNVKINLYTTIVQPITTYPSDFWQETKMNNVKLATVEMDSWEDLVVYPGCTV